MLSWTCTCQPPSLYWQTTFFFVLQDVKQAQEDYSGTAETMRGVWSGAAGRVQVFLVKYNTRGGRSGVWVVTQAGGFPWGGAQSWACLSLLNTRTHWHQGDPDIDTQSTGWGQRLKGQVQLYIHAFEEYYSAGCCTGCILTNRLCYKGLCKPAEFGQSKQRCLVNIQ